MNRPVFTLFLCFCAMALKGQDDRLPADLRQHNLTTYNASLFNPAFSLGRNNPESVALWVRWQWQGIDSDPSTLFLNYTRKLDDRSAAGAAFFQHNTGIFFNTGAALNYAYKFEFNPRVKLAVGANLFGFKQTLADDRFQVDPSLPLPLATETDDFILQMAPGISLEVERLTLSLASENLLDYNFRAKEGNTAKEDKIFMSLLSYDFPVALGSATNFFLRPSMYLRTIPGQSNQVGFYTLLNTDRYWGQVGYNNFYGFSLGGGYTFFKRLSVGALAEFGTGASLVKESSFELMAAYFLGTPEERHKMVGHDIGEDFQNPLDQIEEEQQENEKTKDEATEEELEKEETRIAEERLEKERKEAEKREKEAEKVRKEETKQRQKRDKAVQDSIAKSEKDATAAIKKQQKEAEKEAAQSDREEEAREKAQEQEAELKETERLKNEQKASHREASAQKAADKQKAEQEKAEEESERQKAEQEQEKADKEARRQKAKKEEADRETQRQKSREMAEKREEARKIDSINRVKKAEADSLKAEQQRKIDSVARARAAAIRAAKEAEEVQSQEKGEEVSDEPEAGEKYEEVATEAGLLPGYYLIANVFGTQKYYDAFMVDLQKKGMQPKSFRRSTNGYNYVYLQRYKTIQQAREARDNQYGGRYTEKTWIFRVTGE